MIRAEAANRLWEIETYVMAAAGVKLLIRLRRHLLKPIGLIDAPVSKATIKQVRGRGVVQEVGAVLAADQVYVIDSEIGGDLLVARWLVVTLPLDAVRNSPAEAIR